MRKGRLTMTRKQIIFCSGCASLFFIRGQKPLCVATAGFVEGTLRSRVDIVGLTSAEKRNLRNGCSYRKIVSIHAWQVKRWLLERMAENGNKIKQGNISDYSLEEEAQQKVKLQINETQGKPGKQQKEEFPKGSPGEGTRNSQEPDKKKAKSPSKVKTSSRIKKGK